MLAGHAKSAVDVTVKWDGCLEKTTKVLTNEGTMTLEEVHESWHSNRELYVFAHIEETGEDTYVPIQDCLSARGDKSWVDIHFGDHKITCTENHQFLTTNRGWVDASNLVEGDDVKDPEFINK